MKVQLVQEVSKVQRVMRSPKHEFQVRHKPWQIQPFFIAPVLPGETLKNLLVQARVVTDPIKSKLVGWWYEQYYFYVKHRDLMPIMGETITNMHLTGAALTAYKAGAASADFFTYQGGVKWVELCLQRVVEEYFRNEEDGAWDAHKIGNLPLASVSREAWFNSLIDDTATPPAPNDLQDKEDLTVISEYQEMYNRMVQMRFTDMTFEDWLRQHGVRGVQTAEPESAYRPELVRYIKEWTYPTNTVDPATGVPSSAAVWSIQERADKDRFFKEPGFLFGVCVARPKVYFSKQTGNAAGALDEARLWLPAVFRDEPYTSIKEFTDPTTTVDGPLGATPTNGYWVDLRDLFIYGDQFRNFDIEAAGDGSHVLLPSASLQKRYASEADANALFAAAAPANQIRADGVVSLNILGTAGRDQT